MIELKKERMLDLQADRALVGLDETEAAELRELEELFPELAGDFSLEIAASALSLSYTTEIEPLPESLRTKITRDAETFFTTETAGAKVLQFQPQLREEHPVVSELQPTFSFEPKKPFMQWLGWAFGGLACLALALTLIFNQPKTQTIEVVRTEAPKVQSPAEQYAALLASASDLKRVGWTNPKNDKESLGEVVWSDSQQKGFMKFKGLSANDVAREAYQLWIFDESQDEKTPIDGGVFDLNSDGEVIVPINAKLKVVNPKLFAITVEKPGGVVVSKREKIVAVAKV